MNLLLLLSALLSALTGAVPGVRRAEVPQAVAQQVAVRAATRVAVAAVAVRPVAALPTRRTIARGSALTAPAFAVTPIWIDRRRE